MDCPRRSHKPPKADSPVTSALSDSLRSQPTHTVRRLASLQLGARGRRFPGPRPPAHPRQPGSRSAGEAFPGLAPARKRRAWLRKLRRRRPVPAAGRNLRPEDRQDADPTRDPAKGPLASAPSSPPDFLLPKARPFRRRSSAPPSLALWWEGNGS